MGREREGGVHSNRTNPPGSTTAGRGRGVITALEPKLHDLIMSHAKYKQINNKQI